MLVEIIGYVVQPPAFDINEDGTFEMVGGAEQTFEPISLNPEAVSFVMPGDDEQNALIFTLDGMTIMTKDPYHFIKNKLQTDCININLGNHKN